MGGLAMYRCGSLVAVGLDHRDAVFLRDKSRTELDDIVDSFVWPQKEPAFGNAAKYQTGFARYNSAWCRHTQQIG